MPLAPGARKFVLTAHVTASVGWLGAVIVFLALAVIALTSRDPQTVRGVYLVMEPAGWFVLVPLAFASLITGLIQSLGTRWGLFRHYWIVFKFLINVTTVSVLLLYMQTLGTLADIAAGQAATSSELGVLRSPGVALHATLALLLLLAATALSVFKPQGLTSYGRRRATGNRS